jgi:hypothetical protein
MRYKGARRTPDPQPLCQLPIGNRIGEIALVLVMEILCRPARNWQRRGKGNAGGIETV